MTCDFIPGEKLYTVGIDMQCRRVVVCCRFVRMHPDGRVVTQSRSGIKVIGGPVSDYHKTRESVRDQIRKEGK